MKPDVIEIMARAMCDSLMPSIICPDSCRCIDHSNAVRAALSALESAGLRIVPVEPTNAMIEAGCQVREATSSREANTHATWHAMLAAAGDRAALSPSRPSQPEGSPSD